MEVHKLAMVLLSSSLLLFFLPCLTRAQDDCAQELSSCGMMVTSRTQEIAGLLQTVPANLTALTSQCQTFQAALNECEREAQRVCPASDSIQSTLQSLLGAYDSLCGTEIVCTLRVQTCSQDLSKITDITNALAQTPPNVQVIKEKCSRLTGKVRPCLQKLQSDCSNVTSVAASIPALVSSLDSLCGQGALCQLQLGRCHLSFANLSASGDSQDADKLQQVCRAQKAAKMCLATEVDAGCRELPELAPMINTVNSTIMSIVCEGGDSGSGDDKEGCPQVFQCLSQMRELTGNNCSSMSQMMECLSGLKGVCNVKETTVTFKQLESVAIQTCRDVRSNSRALENCTQLGKCITESDVVRNLYTAGNQAPNAKQLKRMFQLILDANTWCQYLEVVSSCYVSSADTCDLDTNLVSSMSQRSTKLKDTCPASSSDGVRGSALNYLLVAGLAIFTAWLQFLGF